jgi:hypothetical protein
MIATSATSQNCKKKKTLGSKHLLPFNAKSLLGCEPMTEHQKIDKNVLDQDIDNKYGN